MRHPVWVYITLVCVFVCDNVFEMRGSNRCWAEDFTEGQKLFALQVRPLLLQKCLACHGEDPADIGGAFDLRSRESMLSGGESFEREVVVLGKGEDSYLYRLIAHLEDGYEMPPKLADRLTEEQTWLIRDWINAGAPWPSAEQVTVIEREYAQGEQVRTSKALSEDWQNRRYEPEKLWAYRPLTVEDIPDDVNPVDFFVNRKLKLLDLQPAADAPALRLARRMSFGLTGLPPTPEQSRKFAVAYELHPQKAALDFGRELMGSPHYGEHFGQHWLDVTRYADSAGFANDYARPHAWRYRDYVVRAFNEDKPFNQFVKEQLAGDEMDPTNPEFLIATGFLRMGPWEQTSMSVFKETRQMWLDDVTDNVGQTFLGHAMQCAKCHDHKFDPVPTRDYYRLMAVFSTTQHAERPAAFQDYENLDNFESANGWVEKKNAYYQEQLSALKKLVAARKKQESGDAKVGDNGLDPGDEASMARMNKNISRHKIELDRTQAFAHSVYTGKTIPKKNVMGRQSMPQTPWKKGQFEADVIYTGGSVYSPGDAVIPGALSAAESLGVMEVAAFPTGQGKRRLALAKWIANERNPLTARVIVNRVWSWHFGRGLAGNPNNLGGTGALPTHPALLDYLAHWFVQHDWSIKQLNEVILSSATYRRDSQPIDADRLAKLDPKNEFYAVFMPRRLTAEELRDAMLSVSGELNPTVGGIACHPDINIEVSFQPRQIMGGTASVYEPDPLPAQRNRRSLYAEKLRGLRDPFFETFNQPGFDDSCELRETSIVAPQSLTLLNAEEVQDRALAFAARLLKRESEDRAVIAQAFELAVSRTAETSEIDLCLAAWKAATLEEQQLTPQPKEFATSLERTVRAEKTGEPYTFTEHMPNYESYTPDLQRSDVDARTRGLSQVCLVLFNSNEFCNLD